jgi:hypothetical protein
VEHFRANVKAARELGYWMTEQHLDPGLRGIAMPLKDRKGECKGAIGMTLQTQSYTTEAMQAKLLPLLREAAQCRCVSRCWSHACEAGGGDLRARRHHGGMNGLTWRTCRFDDLSVRELSTSTWRGSRCSRSSSTASTWTSTATTSGLARGGVVCAAPRTARLCAADRPGQQVRRAVDGPGDHDEGRRAASAWGARWCGVSSICRGGSFPAGMRISAQSRLERFYAAEGFVIVGERYMEDGIPHTEMLLPAHRRAA